MGYSKDPKDTILAEGNVIAVLELTEKYLGGRWQSPEFYLTFFGGSNSLVRQQTSES